MAADATPERVAKLCGADIELGNFVLGLERSDGTGREASRALLREIKGVSHTDLCAHPAGGDGYEAAYAYTASGLRRFDPQDWGRKFLASNGGCAYIDLDHLELCIPEVRSAFDHVAAVHAMLRVARAALDAANARRCDGERIQVLVNNSDGQSHSYGSHLSFLVTREAWDGIFNRRLHYQQFLASFQASSIVMTGQGKVGSENEAAPAAYQLSQRADFFETLTGEQTTCRRPLVNSRDEALCGGADELARLHCIFFDSTLCHGSSLLRVGPMQIVLAMIEAQAVDVSVLLDDPVASVRRWSHDPSLRARAAMVSGPSRTAVELQFEVLAAAKRFSEQGGCDGVVPRAPEILALWEDTLCKLEAGDLAALAPRLDWVLKLRLLQRVMQQRPNLTWRSPEIKHLDHLYGSLDRDEGLYWACERSGAVERLVDEACIERFAGEPPEDTRAWARAMLLRRFPAEAVRAVDWDSVTVAAPDGSGRVRIHLADPLSGRRETEDLIALVTARTPVARRAVDPHAGRS